MGIVEAMAIYYVLVTYLTIGVYLLVAVLCVIPGYFFFRSVVRHRRDNKTYRRPRDSRPNLGDVLEMPFATGLA